jgi:hypothetical protein
MTAISVLLDAGVQEERIIFISLIAAPLVCHVDTPLPLPLLHGNLSVPYLRAFKW